MRQKPSASLDPQHKRMNPIITCPSCARSLRVPEDYLGRMVKCPGCATGFVAEAAPVLAVAPPVVAVPAETPVAAPPPWTGPSMPAGDRVRRQSRTAPLLYLALFPLGIPLAALLFAFAAGWSVKTPLLLAGLLGVILVVACVALAFVERWSPRLRVIASLALSGTGYLGMLALLLLAFALQGGARLGSGVWKDFASEEGRFRVVMPGVPSQKKEQLFAITFGPPTMFVMNAVELKERKTVYAVTYIDEPTTNFGTPPPPVDAAKMLEEMRDKKANGGGKLTRDVKVALDGHPGRDLEIEGPGEAYGRFRYFVVGKRRYSLSVVSEAKRRPAVEDVDKFFDSFKLTTPQ